MKNFIITAILFIAAVCMLAGCENTSSNDNSALSMLMLSGLNRTYGSQEDVVAGSQAGGGALAAANSVTGVVLSAKMTSTPAGSVIAHGAGDFSKDSIQESVMQSIVKKAVADLNSATLPGKKADTSTINDHYTTTISVPGYYTIIPDIIISGTITANTVNATTTEYVIDVTMTGSAAASFTNYPAVVFDVYNFVHNNQIGFNKLTLNGNCTTTINNSMKGTIIMSQSTVGTVTTAYTNGSTKSSSISNATSSGITITVGTDAPVTHAFELESKTKSDYTSSSTMTIDSSDISISITYHTAVGSMSVSLQGNIDDSFISYSYSLNDDTLLQYFITLSEQ